MSKLSRTPMSEYKRSIVEWPPNSHSSPLLQPPSFDKLSMELIQFIFGFACPKVVFDLERPAVPFHFKLGSVCTKWRAVVAAHRSLWATFVVDVSGPWNAKIDVQRAWNPKFGTHLRNYLKQSGTYPLTIKVRTGPAKSDEILFKILDILIPHCERWVTIKLDFFLEYPFLLKLEAVRDRLPLLQRLRIMGPLNPYPTGTPDSAVFRNTPSLTRLSVSHIDADSDRVLTLPWTRVSRVNLDFTSFVILQSSLELLQTLTALTLTEQFSYNRSALKPPVTLEKLQVLRVRDELGVGHFTCPSLRRLEVIHEEPSAICKLLDNSSCSLLHLELRGFGECSLSPIIQHASLAGLTFLRLEGTWVTNGDMHILIFDSTNLLPLLEVLHVEVELESYSKEAKKEFKLQMRHLQSIVASRTYGLPNFDLHVTPQQKVAKPLKEFHFTLTEYGKGWVEWRDKELQRLRHICKSKNLLAVLTGAKEYYPDYTYDDSDESDSGDDNDHDNDWNDGNHWIDVNDNDDDSDEIDGNNDDDDSD